MVAITETYRATLTVGSRVGVVVQAATAPNGYTLDTGLSFIEWWGAVSDSASLPIGGTVSSGVITFANKSAGSATNPTILAIGFE